MKVNEEYLQRMFAVFGKEAEMGIRKSVASIVKALEEMTPAYQKDVIAILDDEVKKAIIFD